MANFPPTRTLIVPPSQNYSFGATASLSSPKPNYPASKAVDGTLGGYCRSNYGTDALVIDLGGAQSPNIFGVFQHNIDAGLVCSFQASNGMNRGAAARRPHFWLDLRGFPPTAQSYQLGVNGNSRPLIIGEVVIATGFVFTGSLSAYVDEQTLFWQERREFEFGKMAISASGSLTRMGTLAMSVTAAELVQLDQVFEEAGSSGERVVVVPDTRRNDIWFVEWPANKDVRYRQTDQDAIEVVIPLVEESGGVA